MPYKPYEWYNIPFFSKNMKEQMIKYQCLPEYIIENFNPKTVVDYGCGAGYLVKELNERGIDTIGFEGFEVALEVIDEDIKDKVYIHNLLDGELIQYKKYDLCICTFVMEHIDRNLTDTLMKTMTNLSDTILYSSAIGRHGHHHINCLRNKEILNKFDTYNYECDIKMTDEIRKYLYKQTEVKSYKNEFFIFRRKEE